MSNYYPVSLTEMRDALKLEKGWAEDSQHNEIVFNYTLKHFPVIQIKVYTGIRKDTGVSRSCGDDAIRVCAVNIQTHQGWIKSARVYRVEGWRKNLEQRVLKVIEQAKARAHDNGMRFQMVTQVKPQQKQVKDLRGEQEVLHLESLHS